MLFVVFNIELTNHKLCLTKDHYTDFQNKREK